MTLKKKFIFPALFLTFLFTPAFAQQIYEPSTDRNGPQMTFDQNEIIDTITIDKLVEGTSQVAMNRYEFHFTNTGKQPLLVGYSNGSDPDFNCDYPTEPIKPGERGTIVICASPERWRMDKTYNINSTSVVPQSIHIKRVSAVSDSDLVRSRRKYESHCMRMYVDSLPYSKRESLKTERNYSLIDHSYYLVDTTVYFFSFDEPLMGPYGTLREKKDADIPPGTVLRIEEEAFIVKVNPGTLYRTDYYYDKYFGLIQKRIITIKDVPDDHKGTIYFLEENIDYKKGIETGRTTKILKN
jgi:hypothetical protein